MICQFCNKKFANEWNMRTHQQTAKYCIKLQSGTTEIKHKSFSCSLCKKDYTTNQGLKNHKCSPPPIISKSITSTLLDKITIMEKELNELKEKVKNKSSSDSKIINNVTVETLNNTTINNNNTIINNNTFVFNPERISGIFDNKFDDTFITKDYNGLVRFILKHVIVVDGELKYICNDYSRCSFSFHDIDGNKKIDHKAKHLISIVKPSSRKRLVEVMNILKDKVEQLKKSNEYRDLDDDETRLMDKMNFTLGDALKLLFKISDMDTNTEFPRALADVLHTQNQR